MKDRKKLKGYWDFQFNQMVYEAESFVPHWKLLSENFLPRRGRFMINDVNEGDRRHNEIIDATGMYAVRTLRSGMMAGASNPSRNWFKLSTPGGTDEENPEVRFYLHKVTNDMRQIFLKSNLYNVLPIAYGDMSVFGTAAVLVEEDFDKVMRFTSIPVGSFYIANDPKGKVNTFARQFRWTVKETVEKFGRLGPKEKILNKENFSEPVVDAWENGRRQEKVDIIHVIGPNPEYKRGKFGSRYKKFQSVYYERSQDGALGNISTFTTTHLADDKFLRIGGYDYFPVLCPRWEVTGEDVYGTNCPGMEALGDSRQLQKGEKKSMKAVDKMIDPPVQSDASNKSKRVNLLPKGVTYTNGLGRQGADGYRPIHEINFPITMLEEKQEEVRMRIRRAFYEDIFLNMITSDRREMTAREVDERSDEKLLALGPVLDRLNVDLFDPLIELAFMMMHRQGLLPEPPEELEGMELKVEYISIMAVAQKLLGIAGVERFLMFTTQVAQVNPDSLKKVDFDQMLDVVGDMTSIPPGVVRSDEETEQMRAAEQQQLQQQQMMEMLQQGADTAHTLSQTDTSGDNALTDIAEGMTGL
jgi:hypothetical protein